MPILTGNYLFNAPESFGQPMVPTYLPWAAKCLGDVPRDSSNGNSQRSEYLRNVGPHFKVGTFFRRRKSVIKVDGPWNPS